MLVLERLKELFKDRKQWTQHLFARTILGVGTASNCEDAVCWCLVGGLTKVSNSSLDYYEGYNALQKLTEIPLPKYNDTHTYEEVMALIERGIQCTNKG